MSSAPQAAPAPATPRSHGAEHLTALPCHGKHLTAPPCHGEHVTALPCRGEHVTALPCREEHVTALPWCRLPATAWLALTTTLALAGTLVLVLNGPTADPANVAEAPATGQWQGERWRLNAALRACGGPADAVLAQLPQRRAAVLAAAWVF